MGQKYQPLDLGEAIAMDDLPPAAHEGSLVGASRLLLLLFLRCMDDIEEYQQKNQDRDDFNEDLGFQQAFEKYTGTRLWGRVLFLGVTFIVGAIWIIGLLVYGGDRPDPEETEKWRNGTYLGELMPFDLKFRNMTMDTVRQGHYYSFSKQLQWLEDASFPEANRTENGAWVLSTEYLLIDDRPKTVHRVVNYDDMSSVLTFPEQIEYRNNFFYPSQVFVNPGKPVDSGTWHMFATDVVGQWRLSLFALYFMWNLDTNEVVCLQPPQVNTDDKLEKLHWAYFSPNGEHVLFSFNHDLYLWNLADQSTERLTDDGLENIFHGRTDWVYEEEVSASDNMVWWAPDSLRFAFITLDDTKVDDYDIDYFVKDPTKSSPKDTPFRQYPMTTRFKYPKPGRANPIPQFRVFDMLTKAITDLDVDTSKIGRDYVVYHGDWLDNNNFLVKLTDRTLRLLCRGLWQPQAGTAIRSLITTNVTEDFGGWVEKTQAVAVIPKDDGLAPGYVDKVVNTTTMRTHLAYFDSPDATTYKFITSSNDWHITQRTELVYSPRAKRVFALATVYSTMDLTLLAVDPKGDNDIEFWTDPNQPGLHMFVALPRGDHIDLRYLGPHIIPWQRIISVDRTELIMKERQVPPYQAVLEGFVNAELTQNIEQSLTNTNFPSRRYHQVVVDHYSDGTPILVNMVEILPPGFDPSRKYPVVVDVYGGPGLQKVDRLLTVQFRMAFLAMLDCIVLAIDPRGTGGQDWRFMGAATNRIGYWEPRDLVTVTQQYLANNTFALANRTAVWGWLYGGFTTLRTLEYDKGETFQYGVAVAPVTNWMFYDLIYTERFMMQPQDNPNYNYYSQIRNTDNLAQVSRFLVMHGTADDNVHFQNSMWLLNKFDEGKLENYDVHFFPDSDHLIRYDGADKIVYDKIVHWLGDAFRGKFDGNFDRF